MPIPPGLPYHGRWNRYSSWLRARYGGPTARVPVDGGFSCPNRRPDGSGGCSFCDSGGSRSPVLGSAGSVAEQADRAASFQRARYGAEVLLLYFQAFTSTHASPDRLRELYDAALSRAPFRGLIVATRPDCLDREKAGLLASYRARGLDVWVELGLQSSSDATLARIRRGHGAADFTVARNLLRDLGIPVSAHVVFGLPGEAEADMLGTVRYLADLDIEGIKIHDLHIPFGCGLYREAREGELVLLSPRRHLDLCVRALELLPPDTVIQRLTTDTPEDRRALPRRAIEKAGFLRNLDAEMDRRDTWQGRLYGAGAAGAATSI